MDTVELSWAEVLRACVAAVTSRIRALRKAPAPADMEPYSAWDEAVESTCAEMAVAKSLGVYWAPGRLGWAVRSTWRQGGSLVVRGDDDDARVYVLAVGTAPSYRIAGWIRGIDAKMPRFCSNAGYFVPQSELRPWARRPAFPVDPAVRRMLG